MTVTSYFNISLEATIATTSTAGPAFVTALANGDSLIVQDHISHVHTQLFDSTGSGSPPQHQIDFGQLDTEGPAALLTNGTVVLLSRDTDSIGYTIQSYSGTASVRTSADINTASDQGRVVALSSGGFVITYMTPITSKDTDIAAKVYDATGVLQNTLTVDAANSLEDHPAPCSLAGGGFVVAWESVNAIRYAVYNDDGSLRSAAKTLLTDGLDQNPSIVATEDGGFAIAYQTNKFNITTVDIALARFTSSGDLTYDKAIIHSAVDATTPSMALLPGHLLAIGYTSVSSVPDSHTYMVLVDAATGDWAGGQIIGAAAVNPDFASVSTLSDGRIVAINTDANGLVSGGIYALGIHYWNSDDASDSMLGGDAVDVMYGGIGSDSLYGGEANDTLYGSDGADLFVGGYGDNQIIGGRGPDTVDYRFATGTVLVDLQMDTASFETNSLGTNSDVLLSVENVLLGAGDDYVFASDASNFIDGGDGRDFLDGAFGDDTLLGGTSADTIDSGGQNDMVYGGTGNDSLTGGSGVDWIDGGTGRDVMTGETGNDTFAFNVIAESSATTARRDIITDFAAGHATTFFDKIDLSSIDAVKGGSNDAFHFIVGTFTAAGQVNAVQVGSDVLIRVNTVGTMAAEMTILLQNVLVSDIGANDFVL